MFSFTTPLALDVGDAPVLKRFLRPVSLLGIQPDYPADFDERDDPPMQPLVQRAQANTLCRRILLLRDVYFGNQVFS
jgi:hypothetical protein